MKYLFADREEKQSGNEKLDLCFEIKKYENEANKYSLREAAFHIEIDAAVNQRASITIGSPCHILHHSNGAIVN